MNVHITASWGFPREDIIRLCKRLITVGTECRSDAHRYARQGNHVKAYRLNREANDYHRRVLNMFELYDGLRQLCGY